MASDPEDRWTCVDHGIADCEDCGQWHDAAKAASSDYECHISALTAERDAASAREDSYRGETDVLRVRLDKARDEARVAEADRDALRADLDAAREAIAAIDPVSAAVFLALRAQRDTAQGQVTTLLEAIAATQNGHADTAAYARALGNLRAVAAEIREVIDLCGMAAEVECCCSSDRCDDLPREAVRFAACKHARQSTGPSAADGSPDETAHAARAHGRAAGEGEGGDPHIGLQADGHGLLRGVGALLGDHRP
jgi:hypothetical protein